MHVGFWIVGLATVASAIAAISLRNLVHCALCLSLTFAGIAALYLQLGAEFIGLAQILVYVGAVAILIVFAVLLTRSGDQQPGVRILTSGWSLGIGIAVIIASVFAYAISRSKVIPEPGSAATPLPVKRIGLELLGNYILPLEVVGLLLTAAMIGAIIIALPGPRRKTE